MPKIKIWFFSNTQKHALYKFNDLCYNNKNERRETTMDSILQALKMIWLFIQDFLFSGGSGSGKGIFDLLFELLGKLWSKK